MANWRRLTAALGASVAIGGAAQAASVTYQFKAITNNSIADVAIGETQLSLAVSDVAGDASKVDFTFVNAGPLPSVIAQVYFDNGDASTLDGIVSLFGSGVSFTADSLTHKVNPGELPGANNAVPDFQTSFLEVVLPNGKVERIYFCADADSPAPTKGVNPGDWLTVRFALKPGKGYSNVLAAMSAGAALDEESDGRNGTLRVGVHVTGFADGKSESFISTIIPIPPAVWGGAGLMGLAGVAGLVRRQRIS